MLQFLTSIPWPFCLAAIAFGAACVLMAMSAQNIDHRKWEELKAASPLNPMRGRLGSSLTTERGVRLLQWFFVAAAVFVISMVLGFVLQAYGKI